MSALFHLAFPVTDLERTRAFYGDVLGAHEGDATDHWVDFELFGHQLSAHRVETMPEYGATGVVDGKRVPIPHFGLVLHWRDWERMIERLRLHGQSFLLEPQIRFANRAGEQGTFFLYDPFGNALEFKAFRRPEEIYQRPPKPE